MNEEDAKVLRFRNRCVSRRDVGSDSKEEQIDFALNKAVSLDKLVFFVKENHNRIKSIRERDETQFTYIGNSTNPFSIEFKTTFTSSTYFFFGMAGDDKADLRNSFQEELTFSSAEQFVMYHKAILFFDRETASRIMQASSSLEFYELGRQVKNFDKVVWKYFRSEVVYEANNAKFKQNFELKDALTNTVGTTLVNVAAIDKIWGIGLAPDNQKAQRRETWEGKNLLGEILTLVRMEAMGKY